MRNRLLKIAVIWALLLFITGLNSFGQSTLPVNITFEENTATVMAVDARPENNQAVIDEWTWVK